ncbi:hypothetical protein [uncultured Psychrobacter sp.]|uniref:hypothetical protein n=1 Tax=uncultured Psychrobacter sp. TaxID=259303 RepID=UPI003457AC26
MALEGGGFADKFGNSYEAIWVAKQLLRLAEEKIRSITVEPLGDDETGVDLIIEDLHGNREFHQCKASNSYADVWSLSRLEQAEVLKKAYNQVYRTSWAFKIVSPLSFTQLSHLSLSANNTTDNPQDFIKEQVNQSERRRTFFEDLCSRLKLDIERESDVINAINFLKKFEVINFSSDSDSLNNINNTAQSIFIGEPSTVIDFLKNYPIDFNRLRLPITTSQLLNDMQMRGFNLRVYENDERVFSEIKRINCDFQSTIKPFLIDDSLIKRPELEKCLEFMNSYPITLIKAEAGMGKSAFLLQLCDYLNEQEYISLPIRLDRNRPEKNADAFGLDLGLTHSPVFCLNTFAGDTKAVIILDQLDAIRWTANHSSNALQVCQEIARQVIQLRENNHDICLVLACRDFDLKEDPQLQYWIKELNDKVAHIELSELPSEQVKEILNPYENYDFLSPIKQSILRIPIWLSLYLQIIKDNHSNPDFTSKIDLISLYWKDRLTQLNNTLTDTSLAHSIVDDFVEKASQNMQLSIPISLLSNPNPSVLEALISVGILHKHENQISFQHQALFDYHLGKRLFDTARQSSEALIEEIGSKSEQTLTRREHIKYALKLLSQDRQSLFCQNISALLDSPEIRFHIKYLAINVIGEVETIKAPMRNLIINLISDEKLSQPFINNACFEHPQIVEVLSEKNVISEWLNGSDSQIDLAIRLLSSVAGKAPDIVIKEIEPFIGVSEEWNNRCYSALNWNIQDDSEEMFAVRKRLWMLNCSVRNISWERLIKNQPYRMLDILNIMLEEYKNNVTSSKANNTEQTSLSLLRQSWHQYQLEGLKELSVTSAEELLAETMPKIFDIVSNQVVPTDKKYFWLNKSRFSSNKPREHLIENILDVLILAGEKFTDNEQKLYQLLSPHLLNRDVIVEYVMAHLLFNLSVEYSNHIIEWLLERPVTRLACGNKYKEPKWILPGKLIEKFSAHCSDSLFNVLESKIIDIEISKKIESIVCHFESRRKYGYFNSSYWGEAQYFLLKKLDATRVSPKSVSLYQVLQRRFEGCNDTYFYSYNSLYGGVVVSPLPQPNTLSDRSWRKLILTDKERFSTWNTRPLDSNTVVESSIQAFATSLSTAVKNEPARFAKIALALPKDINEQFIESICYGLADNNSSNLAEGFKENWQPCPLDLRYEVIRHFEDFNESQALTRLLADTPKIIDHPDMLDKLIDITLHSSNPDNNKLNVYSPEEGDDAEHATAKSLVQNSINCYRGIAYGGIAKIFWDNEEYARDNLNLIDSAINDPHPAVKIVAVELLAPFLNYDTEYALQKFLELCHADLRMSCAHYAHYFFNFAFIDEFQYQYLALVKLMLTSGYEEVRKQAGTQIFARYFFNDLFESELATISTADESIKLGIAQVLAQLLSTDDYAEQEHKLVDVYKALINDSSQKVRDELLFCIQEKNFWNKGVTKELLAIYMNSQTAYTQLYQLFYALENHVLNLEGYKSMLLQLFSEITTTILSDESKQNVYSEMDKLTKVLQRIYDEAVDDENEDILNMCLDVWDNLLKLDGYAVSQASKHLENGLLS